MTDNQIHTPLVSAVITTHNRLELLKRAVKSVQTQTYPNIELIVVDDGSDDGTQEWCESGKFTYVRIPKGESRGGNYARNLGIKASNGEYIAFLDDDDYWLPTKTEKQVLLALKHPSSVIYCFRTYEIIRVSGVERVSETKQYELQGNISRKALLSPCVASTSALFVPKNCLLKIGMWDEEQRFWQDNDLILRLAQYYEFYYVDEELVIYLVNLLDKNRLSNKFNEWKKATERYFTKHQELYRQLNFKERLLVKKNYYNDIAARCKLHNKLKWIYYKSLSIFLKYIVSYFFHLLLSNLR